MFFIPVGYEVWLLWLHIVCLDLQREKWKLAISVVSLGTFEFVLQKCLLSSPPCFRRLLYFGSDKNSGCYGNL